VVDAGFGVLGWCGQSPVCCPGAAHGKGRGREVIAVAKSSDLGVMVLDAGKEEDNMHRCELCVRSSRCVG
jgi:ribosome-interacting GTPase 1